MINYSTNLCDAYKEILVLDQMLTEENVSHQLHRLLDGWQIITFDEQGEAVFSIIEHRCSYGCKVDRVEMSLTKNGHFIGQPEGCMSAVDAMKRIKEYKGGSRW